MKLQLFPVLLVLVSLSVPAWADETVHYTCPGTSRPIVTYAASGKTAKLDGVVDYANTALPATLNAVPGSPGIHYTGPGGTVIQGASRSEIVLTNFRRQFKCTAVPAPK